MVAEGMRVPGKGDEAIKIDPQYRAEVGVDGRRRRRRVACETGAHFLDKDQDGNEDVT